MTIEKKKAIVSKALEGWAEDTFCQRAIAKDIKGMPMMPHSPTAVTWSITGRLGLHLERMGEMLEIANDFHDKYNEWPVLVNDDKGFETIRDMMSNLY